MELKDFIVAIEFGSSRIEGLVGKYDKSVVPDEIKIYAIESEESGSTIKRGIIQNVEEVALKVKNIINRLERRIGAKIGKVYFGIAGQSIASIDYSAAQEFNDEMRITDSVVDNLIRKCKENAVPNKEVLQVIPVEYFVNGSSAGTQVIGRYGSEISANYKLIVANPIVKKNILRVADSIGVEVADIYVSALKCDHLLSDTEKNFGAALVDFGAQTTTVSVYKSGMLKYHSVIPLGGDTITSDITKVLQYMPPVAEAVKLRMGCAFPEDREDDVLVFTVNGAVSEYKKGDLRRIISKREEEIVANVMNQLKLSGEEKDLNSGIVLIGMGSLLPGIKELFDKQGFKYRVESGICQKLIIGECEQDICKCPNKQSFWGLLMSVNDNCRLEPENIEIDNIPQNRSIDERLKTQPSDDVTEKKLQSTPIQSQTEPLAPPVASELTAKIPEMTDSHSDQTPLTPETLSPVESTDKPVDPQEVFEQSAAQILQPQPQPQPELHVKETVAPTQVTSYPDTAVQQPIAQTQQEEISSTEEKPSVTVTHKTKKQSAEKTSFLGSFFSTMFNDDAGKQTD